MMGVLVWNWREVKKMTYTYNRKGITRKVLSEIVRGLGAKDELKILKRCFTILTLTLFLRCIFQIPPLRQPKDSGNAKMLVACLRVVSLRCQFFSDIFTKQPHPPARVNLWVGGGGCRLVLDCVENCGQAWRGFMRRDLPQDICFSNLRVGCV